MRVATGGIRSGRSSGSSNSGGTSRREWEWEAQAALSIIPFEQSRRLFPSAITSPSIYSLPPVLGVPHLFSSSIVPSLSIRSCSSPFHPSAPRRFTRCLPPPPPPFLLLLRLLATWSLLTLAAYSSSSHWSFHAAHGILRRACHLSNRSRATPGLPRGNQQSVLSRISQDRLLATLRDRESFLTGQRSLCYVSNSMVHWGFKKNIEYSGRFIGTEGQMISV